MTTARTTADTALDVLIRLDREIQEMELELAELDAGRKELVSEIKKEAARLRGLVRLNDPAQAPLYNQDGLPYVETADEQQDEGE